MLAPPNLVCSKIKVFLVRREKSRRNLHRPATPHGLTFPIFCTDKNTSHQSSSWERSGTFTRRALNQRLTEARSEKCFPIFFFQRPCVYVCFNSLWCGLVVSSVPCDRPAHSLANHLRAIMSKVFVTRAIPETCLKALREAKGVAEVRVNPENRVLTRQGMFQGFFDKQSYRNFIAPFSKIVVPARIDLGRLKTVEHVLSIFRAVFPSSIARSTWKEAFFSFFVGIASHSRARSYFCATRWIEKGDTNSSLCFRLYPSFSLLGWPILVNSCAVRSWSKVIYEAMLLKSCQRAPK